MNLHSEIKIIFIKFINYKIIYWKIFLFENEIKKSVEERRKNTNLTKKHKRMQFFSYHLHVTG